MADRKYSIAEIDTMRAAIGSIISYRNRNSYKPSERTAEIEDQLRTHMVNGTDPAELQACEQKESEAHFAQQRAQQEYYRKAQEEHAAEFPERARPEGIMECLRVVDQRAQLGRDGGYRCNQCNSMQAAGSFIVWVPDSVRIGERAESIINAVRANQFNGSHSGWCVDCARRLTRKAGHVQDFTHG